MGGKVVAMTVAAYTRYSTDKQTENSIAYQMAEITKYCLKNNIDLTAFYSDKEKSGTNTDRDDFGKMIAAAKRKEFEAIVIYDITRGSRDVGDWFAFRKEMLRNGVKVISVTQNLGDITNPNDFLTEAISAVLGQHNVLDTRKKSMDGVTTKAKKGAFLGGVAPLGYEIISKQYYVTATDPPVEQREYSINPTEAATVQKIFNMYADGASYSAIIDSLGGMIGKRGKPIGKNSLYIILKNERYIGVYTWNKYKTKLFRKWAGGALNPDHVRIEDKIPPIIEKDIWERVQKRMNDNKRNATNKAKRTYLLSGLIECENCGGAFVGHVSKNTRGYETRYYMCGNKQRTRTCSCKNIKADLIEMFVIENLRNYLQTTDFEAVAAKIADEVNGASLDLSKEKNELATITTQIKNGMSAILGGMKFPELEDEIDRLRTRKEELTDIIKRNQSTTKKVDPKAIVKLFKDSVANLDGGNIPQMIQRFISKIYARADGSFTVYVGVNVGLTDYCGGWI